jgi:hypothetical protein
MKIISSRLRYRCGLFTVTEDHATDPSGLIKRSSSGATDRPS